MEIHALRIRARGTNEYPLSSTECPRGYYLPASLDEIQRFSRTMHSRQREIGQAVALADKYLAQEGVGESDNT